MNRELLQGQKLLGWVLLVTGLALLINRLTREFAGLQQSLGERSGAHQSESTLAAGPAAGAGS